MYDQADSLDPSTCFTSSGDKDLPDVIKLDDTCSVVTALSDKVEKSGQLFIVIRRGCQLSRIIDVWKRAVKKDPSCTNKRVMVCFCGEEGIDSGAMALEFFTLVLPDIGSAMFPSGSPVDSTFHVQNSSFFTCGQIVASSLAQGGPPPCFLDESVFNLMVEPNIRPNEIDESKHLTESDRAFLKSVQDDLKSHTDTIIDNGYTGVIDEKHRDQIIKSVVINIISKRLLYMYVREYMDGLKSFGLADIIQSHPESCRTLFVKCSQPSKVDANYLYSILHPMYSQEGSSRRKVEESIMDFFQDFIFKLEDEINILGYTEEIAWNENSESEVSNADQPTEQFQSPDLTPAGILGWLTGQKHIPLGENPLKVSVMFNHDCKVNNPNHRICFPVVGACAREITLSVTHMNTTEDFNEVFLLAFCKGSLLAKPSVVNLVA